MSGALLAVPVVLASAPASPAAAAPPDGSGLLLALDRRQRGPGADLRRARVRHPSRLPRLRGPDPSAPRRAGMSSCRHVSTAPGEPRTPGPPTRAARVRLQLNPYCADGAWCRRPSTTASSSTAAGDDPGHLRPLSPDPTARREGRKSLPAPASGSYADGISPSGRPGGRRAHASPHGIARHRTRARDHRSRRIGVARHRRPAAEPSAAVDRPGRAGVLLGVERRRGRQGPHLPRVQVPGRGEPAGRWYVFAEPPGRQQFVKLQYKQGSTWKREDGALTNRAGRATSELNPILRERRPGAAARTSTACW